MALPPFWLKGLKRGHSRTGWGGYLLGNRGQKMNVDVFVSTYRGGAAQRWHKLSG
jgi:hypothetical protein